MYSLCGCPLDGSKGPTSTPPVRLGRSSVVPSPCPPHATAAGSRTCGDGRGVGAWTGSALAEAGTAQAPHTFSGFAKGRLILPYFASCTMSNFKIMPVGPVAQWIRHRPTEPGIAGSSPAGVISTTHAVIQMCGDVGAQSAGAVAAFKQYIYENMLHQGEKSIC